VSKCGCEPVREQSSESSLQWALSVSCPLSTSLIGHLQGLVLDHVETNIATLVEKASPCTSRADMVCREVRGVTVKQVNDDHERCFES